MQEIFIDPALSRRFETALSRGKVIMFSAPCGCGKTVVSRELLKGRMVDYRDAAEAGCLDRPIDSGVDVLLVDNLQLLVDDVSQKALCTMIQRAEEGPFGSDASNANAVSTLGGASSSNAASASTITSNAASASTIASNISSVGTLGRVSAGASVPDLRVVLLSRGGVSGWLMPFKVSGLLEVFTLDDLRLSRESAQKMLGEVGARLNLADITDLRKQTGGYPAAVAFLKTHLEAGEPYGAAALDATRRDLFHYFDEVVFKHFDRLMRTLLLEVSCFESFTPEMARFISGDNRAGEMVERLQRDTSMLIIDGLDTCHFWPIFHQFLQWKAAREYSIEDKRALYSRAGVYYEMHDDIEHALECYSQCGENRKVSDLLERHSELHPGVGHYYETESYYRSLPPSEVLRSPSLMCGMSMLCALTLDFDESERWYDELAKHLAGLEKNDTEYRETKARLAYLDIALPQRGSKGLVDLIGSLFTILVEKKIVLPAFSVTSTLPSIMNGGKDFCDWSKRDDLLYATMRKPVEAVLGRDGVGLADCAICESKFEKGDDVSARLLSLVSRLGEIQGRGTPDIEFAVVGLLARWQVSQGKAEAARDTVRTLRDRFEAEGETRFLPNIDALLCRIALRQGDDASVEAWLRDDAPKDAQHLRAMWRYRYLTLAGVWIMKGELDRALLVLAPLLPYCEKCARRMDAIYVRLLSAIALFRMGDPRWQDELGAGLDVVCDYRFIWPVAQFGAAILPLLREYDGTASEACDHVIDPAFMRKLIAASKTQAVYYPRFLSGETDLVEPLSAAELQVLKLLCNDLSNAQIGDMLGIKLATVKTHVSHILQKLGVSRRSEAKAAAQKFHLV